jgi:murein DD-endopeptidase MepM/ murein hydrolase activator NlpD
VDHLESGGTDGRARWRRGAALVGIVLVLASVVVAVSGIPALAQVVDPTTTTEPPPDTTPDTTPPTTTPDTTPPTDPPDTTVPSDPTTEPPPSTDPDSSTTTSTTTTQPDGTPPLAPGEALVPVSEFGALTAHQRALVDQIQRATDTFALHLYTEIDLAHRLTTAKDTLDAAVTVEREAATTEILRLAEASTSTADAPRAAAHGRSRNAAVDGRLHELRAAVRTLDGARLAARKTRLKAQYALDLLQSQVDDESHAVAGATADRKSAESALEGELGPDAVRARADGITATLLSAQAGQGDPIVVTGLQLPIPGAALASPFGLRNDPLGGGAGFHPGIDLAASSGTPIQAAADGVVVMAGDCGGYGNCVVIDHGDSVATLYAHQSRVGVSVGQHVTAGQVIGYVGSTGLATGPHLHFEVRVHGIPTDPLLALAPR